MYMYNTRRTRKKNKKYTNNWQFPVQIVQDMYHNSVKSPLFNATVFSSASSLLHDSEYLEALVNSELWHTDR